jgi:HSP20 family protein
MNLTRFEPWSIVDMLNRDLDRLAARRMPAGDSEAAVSDWLPAVDVIEEKDRFVLRADLPGVDPADIEVSMDAGVLSIAGQRLQESRSEDASAAFPSRIRPMPRTSRRSAGTVSSRYRFRSCRKSRRAVSK